MKYVISKVPKKRPEYFLVLKKKISEAGIECEVIEEGKDLLLKVEEQDFEKANTIKKKYKSELGEEIASQFNEILGELKKVFAK